MQMSISETLPIQVGNLYNGRALVHTISPESPVYIFFRDCLELL